MKIDEVAGVGKIVKGVNTTPDVQPGETERQAKKLFPMNKGGKPKSLGVPGASPNVAFNLGLTEDELSVIERAEQFAQQAHKDHQRKYTGDPYYVHLDEVRNIVKGAGGSEDMQAAALLHDTVEDTSVTSADIMKEFGPSIAKLVVELTDISKPEDGNRATRKAMDRDKLAGASAEAQTIKYADLISNGKDIMQNDPKFAKVYMKEKADLLRVMKKGNSNLRSAALDMLPDELKENISVTGTERRRLEKKKGLEIGSPEWFEHWFDLPYLREDIQLNENPVIASILRAIANKGYKVAKDVVTAWYKNAPPGLTPEQAADVVIKTGIGVGGAVQAMSKNNEKDKKEVTESTIQKVDIAQLEKFADRLFGKVGIDVEFTRHFMDRVNDIRNKKPITMSELTRLFKQEYKRWGKPIAQMGPDSQAVMKDLQTDINLPFVLKWDDENNELDLIAKTVMRKADFKTPNKEFPVENVPSTNKPGTFGHKINWANKNKPQQDKKVATRGTQDPQSWWQTVLQKGRQLFDSVESFTDPNFEVEWDEAKRYPEFVKIGKKAWIKLAKTGKPIDVDNELANKIENTEAGEENRHEFDNLEEPKKERFRKAVEAGTVELPIIARYSDGYLELVAGNTRLTGMMNEFGEGKAWIFDVPDEIAVLGESEQLDLKKKFEITPELKQLDSIFKKGKHEIRIVGGAVRDLALGKNPKDIDLATDATPQEMQKMFDGAGVKHIPTGIEHGTITAVLNGDPYEITTLRADVETDGRRAEVEFVRSWEEDAKRRDLTYNAMSMDFEGTLYDYHGGMDDLQDKVTKFVGDPEERIKEDYLRTLRYFRFQGRLDTPTFDRATISAIANNTDGLKQLSVERVWMEMGKILGGGNIKQILNAMQKAGVLDAIGLNYTPNNDIMDGGDPIINLARITDDETIGLRWKMSNEEKGKLGFLLAEKGKTHDKKWYTDMMADGFDRTQLDALARYNNQDDMIAYIKSFKAPEFPVDGNDLIKIGHERGPGIGKTLMALRNQWKQGNFSATKDELLKNITEDEEFNELDYVLKKEVKPSEAVMLTKLGKFHDGVDELEQFVPERKGKQYALHPDNWKGTYYSLTNLDTKKINYYRPKIVTPPAGSMVADMAIANQFYRTKDEDKKQQLAQAYKDSIVEYGDDISHIKFPEILMPRVNESKGYFTRTKSQASKGKALLRTVKPDLEKVLKDIEHKLQPDSSGNRIIITVDKSDVDRVRKLVGLPNLTKVVSEEGPFGVIARKAGHLINKSQYMKAAEYMHKILKRKYKETDGKIRHSLGYYAQMIASQTGMKLNWRELEQEYLNMYGNAMFENLQEDTKMPTVSLKDLYHVGTLDASKKGDFSYEGAGLSVTTEPDAWRRIARGQVAGDTHSVAKANNNFLDSHKLTSQHNEQIKQWAIDNGFLEQQETVTVSWYDDEMDDTLSQTFNSIADAEAEHGEYMDDYDVDVDKGGVVPTAKLQKATGQSRIEATNVLEYVLPLYAETLGLDGVWWADDLDVNKLSAPRGVIVPSKVDSFKFNLKEAPKDWGDMKLDSDKLQQSLDYFYTDHAPNQIGNRREEGNFKGLKIVSFTKGNDTLMFLVNNQDQAVFYVAYSKFKEGIAVGNVRSNGTVRATEVYKMLVDKFGTLYSDAHQTPQGRKIWTDLARFFPDLTVKDAGDRLVATKKIGENFADGKKPGRKGLSKRVGIPKGATIAQLEKIAKNSTGERRRMAQWQLNMRRGKNKSKS